MLVGEKETEMVEEGVLEDVGDGAGVKLGEREVVAVGLQVIGRN